MRLRRMSALFWAGCLVVCCFVLYVMTDLTLKLPSRKTEIEDADDKWIHFENKLKHIESALNEHHAVVGEIRSVVEQYVENTNSNGAPLPANDVNMQNDDSAVENKAVLKMPSQIVREILTMQPFSKEQCNVKMDGLPHADVQMLSVYDRITFDDIDGGVWKQGWRLEYEPNQWNRKKKLRVFIVPHSHNDPGWIKTFEEYYRTQTKSILSNIVSKLSDDSRRTFIWAETSFLSLWWNSDATLREKTMFKSLLGSGQLEIVSGGWVMNDEANSHWLSIVQQLTTGHQWLMDNIKVLPKIAWQIDPFGHSSTQPYLNKLAGMEGSVIQRVHYRVKKELGLNKQLEFRWRQIWDGKGGTDLLTHMFPFYSYDVPHSCGPDPKVCCQFDFKRLPGNSAFCPWRVNPQKITTKNVDERARLILDQWRKKSQLYKSNVVMFPLGDDFRWDRTNEWDNQFSNYDKLLDHLNNNEEFNAEVKFGTLTDYFNAVHEEMATEEFPILSGDFFTYADRNQHYWSGYYTSRPFYKHMDRIVLGYVRAAEMLLAQATANNYVTDIMGMGLKDRVERARRWLSLFQHHDGVTGTARDPVVKDYGNKLQDAIQNCQHVIQLAAYFLLAKPEVERFTDDESFFTVDDIWRQHSELPEQIIITIDPLAQTKRVILHNPLPFQRWETVTVTISTPFIEVLDSKNEPVLCQVSPIVLSEATVSTTKYLLTFTATVKAMALTTYIISATGSPSSYTTYAKLTVYNDEYTQIKLPSVFVVDQHRDRQDAEFTMHLLNSEQRAVFAPSGLLKAVSTTGSIMKPLHMDFVSYGSQRGNDNNSGAYLFIPDGRAQVVTQQQYPVVTVIEGQIMSRLHVQLRYVKHKVTLYNNPSKPQADLEVNNILNLTQIDDYELAMRLSTNIKNGNEFYTDLNGMQMIKRRYFEKLPLQANFYPLPAAAYIQDEDTRLTVLTSTPLGVAALQSGQIEIMQDRRLARDDNRGLNQGVLDNLPTLHTFHILMEESTNSKCQDALPVTHPSGRLTLAAHLASQTLLQPILRLHYSSLQEEIPDYNLNFAPLKAEPGVDVTVVSYRSHLVGQYTNGKITQGSGITLHRTHLDFCYGNQTIQKWYPLSTGEVNIMDIIEFRKDNDLYESSLTYNQVGQVMAKQLSAKLCPMEVRSFFVNQTLFSKERN